MEKHLGIKIYIVILFVSTKNVLWWIWHYSGLAFIAAKASSNKNEEDHPTLILWLISIYVAIFGFASQSYESRLDRVEFRFTSLLSLVDYEHVAFVEALSELVLSDILIEPDFFDPITLLAPFFRTKETIYLHDATNNLTQNINTYLKSHLQNAAFCKGSIEKAEECFASKYVFVIAKEFQPIKIRKIKHILVDIDLVFIERPSSPHQGISLFEPLANSPTLEELSLAKGDITVIGGINFIMRNSRFKSGKLVFFNSSNSKGSALIGVDFFDSEIISVNPIPSFHSNDLLLSTLNLPVSCKQLTLNRNARWSMHTVKDCNGFPNYTSKTELIVELTKYIYLLRQDEKSDSDLKIESALVRHFNKGIYDIYESQLELLKREKSELN